MTFVVRHLQRTHDLVTRHGIAQKVRTDPSFFPNLGSRKTPAGGSDLQLGSTQMINLAPSGRRCHRLWRFRLCNNSAALRSHGTTEQNQASCAALGRPRWMNDPWADPTEVSGALSLGFLPVQQNRETWPKLLQICGQTVDAAGSITESIWRIWSSLC